MTDIPDASDAELLAREEVRFITQMKSLREARNLTQADLAKLLNDRGWSYINQMTISRVEKGERPVRLGEARAISSLLGKAVDEMVAPDEMGAAIDQLSQSLITFRRVEEDLKSSVLSFLEARFEVAAVLHHAREVVDLGLITDSMYRGRVRYQIKAAEDVSKMQPGETVNAAQGEYYGDDSDEIDDSDEFVDKK